MKSRVLLVGVGVVFVMTLTTLLPRLDPVRSWHITQTKPLADGISMRVEGVSGDTKEQSFDFVIPYLPKLTPRGEIKA